MPERHGGLGLDFPGAHNSGLRGKSYAGCRKDPSSGLGKQRIPSKDSENGILRAGNREPLEINGNGRSGNWAAVPAHESVVKSWSTIYMAGESGSGWARR